MTTRFHLESWRKLYRTLPPSWLALPLSARGLGSELLKYVDDDGIFALPPGEKEADAVCRIMCAHRDEWKRVAKDIEALLRDGYLVREPGGLCIRNFSVAQGRTPSAQRMARMRERERNTARNSDATVTVTVTSRSDGSDETRRDTTRHDTTREDPPVGPPLPPETPEPTAPAVAVAKPVAVKPSKPRAAKAKPPAEPPHPRHAEVVEAYFTAFETKRGAKPVFGPRDGAAVKALLQQCGNDADRAITVIRSAFTGDPWLADRATIATIASDPSRYLGKSKQTASRPTNQQTNLQRRIPDGETYDF